MLYYSTNHKSSKADFKKATIEGLAPDGGLYFPESIPKLPNSLINDLKNIPDEEIAFNVMHPFVGDTIPIEELKNILQETLNFDIPLISLNKNINVLELFHGPTMAFKDIGARFMSRCLGYFVKDLNKNVTVLVATSGDTGGAVADGFYNIEGIDVVILYPAGKVSPIQELQLTTHGKNIHAIEVQGTFDDCQLLVKKAFNDETLKAEVFLTSANSINVARWLPQQLYYFLAIKQWDLEIGNPIISVPSGNFGNICAGLLAYKRGLPIKHFIAACNANDVIPQYFQTGNYRAFQSISTIANAMDVGDPSNFIRILELFDHDFNVLKGMMSSYSFTDQETKDGIKDLYKYFNYISDPHGAIGYLGLKKYLIEAEGNNGLFLGTAHAIKFPEVVEKVIESQIPMPLSISDLLQKSCNKVSMPVKYEDLKNYLISRN